MSQVLLSGFADEIGSDVTEQIDGLQVNQLHYLDLRAIGGKNVLDLDAVEIDTYCQQFNDANIGVACIGSPIGKVQIHSDLDAHFARFKVAVERARQFNTSNVRIFSFYHQNEEPAVCRQEVITQLQRMVKYAADFDVTVLHENEGGIYGETPERCRDLFESINQPNFRAIFDPANFLQAGCDPKQRCWPLLAEFVDYFHIKDIDLASQQVVPAGAGDGQIEWLLAQALDNGFSGYLSLEPHLKADHPIHGGNGRERFTKAVAGLRQVLAKLSISAN